MFKSLRIPVSHLTSIASPNHCHDQPHHRVNRDIHPQSPPSLQLAYPTILIFVKSCSLIDDVGTLGCQHQLPSKTHSSRIHFEYTAYKYLCLTFAHISSYLSNHNSRLLHLLSSLASEYSSHYRVSSTMAGEIQDRYLVRHSSHKKLLVAGGNAIYALTHSR